MASEMTTAEMAEWLRDVHPDDLSYDEIGTIADRLETLDALYAKAWAECEAHRDYPTDDELGTGDVENENINIIRMARLGTAMDDHDAARKEAGL